MTSKRKLTTANRLNAGVSNLTPSLRSWDEDYVATFVRLEPCIVECLAPGFDNASTPEAMTHYLGSERADKAMEIQRKTTARNRLGALLEEGFTPDEIEELGLCNLEEAGERSFAGYRNGDVYRRHKRMTDLVEREFMSLPAWIRLKFENDPAVMLDFLADPVNEAHAMALGLERDSERYLHTDQMDRAFDPARGHKNLYDFEEKRKAQAKDLAEREADRREATDPISGYRGPDAEAAARARRLEAEAKAKAANARKLPAERRPEADTHPQPPVEGGSLDLPELPKEESS